jgi:adenylate cyclase
VDDGRGALTSAALSCGSCGTKLPPNSKFCNECGAAVASAREPAEYKQVTVLFADVVDSMDIAAAVGAERLREIMAELVDRATAVVQRYGGTVDKFTGDGIMALFGAPAALEFHAMRACLAALDLQSEAECLATEVDHRDGLDLRLRIGLNSGRVIAGGIGSDAADYTAIGAEVGMAQRMESVAPPGGVMLSESTAALVAQRAVLGEPESVAIKGEDTPVRAWRLLAVSDRPPRRRAESALVGRGWEMTTLTAILNEAIGGGGGCVVNVVGPAGIGKSRLVGEVAAIAVRRGAAVFSTYCEAYASDIPFHVVARLLRAATGVDDFAGPAARAHLREQVPDADPDDLLLLEDLLGIAERDVELPRIDPDARRRRLTALIHPAALRRTEPVIYLIQDAQWIDGVSESMLANFVAVIPRTPSLMLITYRPDYRGMLTNVSGAQTIALRPLSEANTAALTAQLLGTDASVATVAAQVAARAAGNPLFVEEMVRDLAERGILEGEPGAYLLGGDVAELGVPATLQATIGARIDRLDAAAKHTLYAAAVIGRRFDDELLSSVADTAEVDPLIEAGLVEQVRSAPYTEYAFCNPLIRATAYESQLKADRATLHRRLAETVEHRDPGAADQNAARIAEHLEAAGDLRAAYGWHMRAAAWSTHRDIAAALTSWRRARRVADRLPDDDPYRTALRIVPCTLLCGSAWRVGGSGADPGFDELRELSAAAGDPRSLAVGMAGVVVSHYTNARYRQASRLATEQLGLLESIGDPTLTVALSFSVFIAKFETGEVTDVLRLAQQVIDLADGDPAMGNLIIGSPLTAAIACRGAARWCCGIPHWKDDLQQAGVMARAVGPLTRAAVMYYTYVVGITNGVLLPDATADQDTAEALASAERSGDDVGLALARYARGVTLAHRGADRQEGMKLLGHVREIALQDRYSFAALPLIGIEIATERTVSGDLDGAVELSRTVADDLFDTGGAIWSALASNALVEALLRRGGDADRQEAHAAVDRLAALPTDRSFVLNKIWLLRLRTLLALARSDEAVYRDYRDRYRAMARTLGFEGHVKWAEAMH